MLDFLTNEKLGHHLGVFLDVDGVLNTEEDWKRPFTLNFRCVHAFQAALAEAGVVATLDNQDLGLGGFVVESGLGL